MYQTIDEKSLMPSPLKLEVVTPPAVEAVLPNECIDWSRIASPKDRDLLLTLIKVGRDYVEQITRQTLITTTFDLWLDDFPQQIILPARPLQSVTYVKYIDQAGVTQTLSTSNYLVDSKGTRPTIIPPLGTFFPFPKVQTPNAVQVRFVAGYGDAATAVPEAFKLLIKQWVATNYDNREAIVMSRTPYKIPHTFDALLHLMKVWEF